MKKLQYFIILGVMATCFAATAQEGRLALNISGNTFMPTLSQEDSDVELDGIGAGLEAGLSMSPKEVKGVTYGASLFAGAADVDYEVEGDTLSSDISTTALFLDVKYDLLNAIEESPISLSAGLGAGVAFSKLGAFTDSAGNEYVEEGDLVSTFAFRVNLTAQYDINDSLGVFATYQYVNLGSAETGESFLGGTTEVDVDAHVVGAGISYRF